MKKLRIGIAVAAAVFALLLLIAIFVEFDVPDSSQRMLETAAADAGIELTAESFVFNVFGGIRLEGVVATTEIPSGTVTTTLDSLLLNHRLVPLLFGNVVIDRLDMVSPLIVVATEEAAPGETVGAGASLNAPDTGPREPEDAAWRVVPTKMGLQEEPSASETTAAVGRAITIHAASITDGTLLLQTVGDPVPHTTVSGLGVEINDLFVDPAAGSIAIGMSATGHLDVGEVVFADRRAEGNRARLAADAGVYTIEGLELTAAEGSASLDTLVVDLRAAPYTYQTAFSGADLDLNELLAITGEPTLGVAHVEITASGAGPETAGIVGEGTVRLSAGAIPEIPDLEQIQQYLSAPVAGQAYEATTIDFEILDGRIEIAPFELRSEILRLSAAGPIQMDGPLDLRARVSVHRELLELGDLQEALGDVVDALTDDDGWVSVPLVIRGTLEEPSVAPDTMALFAAIRESGVSLAQLMQALINRN